MRFAIDIRYDKTAIAGTSVDALPGETPDAIAQRVADHYARDVKRRNVTCFDTAGMTTDVRTFARNAAESGESARRTITFIDGKPRVSETMLEGRYTTMAMPERKQTDKVVMHLIALSDREIAERHEQFDMLRA